MKQNRKGFTLIELLIVVVIVGILALAAIPLITSNTRDARRSEGEQMLGSMKGQARVAFAKLGYGPTQLTGAIDSTVKGCGVDASELTGQYFRVTDSLVAGAGAVSGNATIETTSPSTADGQCHHTFDWKGGSGSFSWTDE